MDNMVKNKKIVLTGGGTAGHVTPNIALLPALLEMGYDISYMGSHDGIEKKLITDFQIPYYGVSVGKLRRYFDTKNFTDAFRVMKGYAEAKKHLQTIKPDLVFSKGGYVSVPVVRAAASLKIPCVIHESDITPGLANKLCLSAARVICCNFPETVKTLKNKKAVLTGSPIRDELRHGNAEAALKLCGFDKQKPVIMIIGGSLGAGSINDTARAALPTLLEDFQVIHICGDEKVDNMLLDKKGYIQFDYVKSELKDLLAVSELVVSRSGANSICELLALKKPNLLVPLPYSYSRGDQIENARSFESQGFSIVIDDDDLSPTLLVDKIHELYFTRAQYIETMEQSSQINSIQTIVDIIEKVYQEEM
jgi:UDP-N-acetylglucosamine--N-acetylmuramyl-(pentapeptide) pyrophosphoryl-undecaprenol N-acetylglucosamine transferase